jgi:hypothetical protein
MYLPDLTGKLNFLHMHYPPPFFLMFLK